MSNLIPYNGGRDDEHAIVACFGPDGLQRYIDRCGAETTAYFHYFDTHIMDITDVRKHTGVYPVVMYTSEDIQRSGFGRLLAWNRIKLSRDEELWLQTFCKRILPAWLAVRRQHDKEVRKMKDVPPVEDYLKQDSWRWVQYMFDRVV